MHKRLETHLYDRLADLASGDGGRLLEHLAAATASERQAKLEAKRKAAGLLRVAVWLPSGTLDALRTRFPGPRGGIDWPSVAKAALGGTP